MKYYGEKSVSYGLKLIIDLMLVIGGAGTLIVFYNVLRLRKDLSLSQEVITLVLLVVGITCAFFIVINLRRILGSLVKGNPFVEENVLALKRISIMCFVIAGTYIINIIFNSNLDQFQCIYIDYKGIHTDMEFMIFLFAGCFILILSKVFKEAVDHKEENDFTI